MKRHETLAPLSRDHHGALVLAQLIKRNAPEYKGLPSTIGDKVLYATSYYKNELKAHFKKEEILLKNFKDLHHSIATIADEIVAEHIMLKELFHSLNNTFDPEAVLNELGNELDAHIRKEERILFPLIQEHCTEEMLQKISPLLK